MRDMTRENISKTSSDKTTQSRSPRNDNREDGLKVTLPDGRVIIRRPTEDLGQQGYKLSAPHKEGFYRRWVSDATDYRMQYFIDLGFVPATDENGNLIKPRRGGTKKEGGSFNMYLLEIPNKELDRIKSKNEELNSSLKAQKQQDKWLEGQHVEGFTYNPGEGNKVIEKDVKTPPKKQ